MARAWEADPSAQFDRRLGKSARELGRSDDDNECPDIWMLDNGDVAVIGRDMTPSYASRLPDGVALSSDEGLIVLPGNMLIAAKADIPDA
ncbi:hypothetical protein [Murinocardiopsis flavida]|uniref:hypothetical protein n=1 Tax=Murinocardiopsis flavida TaxID=645275 RepID=UPI000D0DC55B|nr:hypothetical protein [Murinocardiopsis flavida]